MSKAACQKWQETNARARSPVAKIVSKSSRWRHQTESIFAENMRKAWRRKFRNCSDVNRKPYYSTPIATKRAGRLAGAFSRPLLAGELASPTMANTSFGIWRLCRFEKRREIPLQRCCWMRRI
ncbi:Tryptophan--tRNA ligase [Trichinella pseudospiralis]